MPAAAPFTKKIVPSGNSIMFPMIRPCGKLGSCVHAVDTSGVMLTHEDDAGWFTRDGDGVQLLMFCPPQKRIVAVYLLAGVSGSITDPPEAGYVLTAL